MTPSNTDKFCMAIAERKDMIFIPMLLLSSKI